MYIEGNVPTMVSGNGNTGFGNGWEGLIGLALVAGLFDGGFGFGGGNRGNGSVDASIQRGFDTQSIISKLDGINNGLCDGFYAQNTNLLNGFAGVQQTLCQGFGGVNSAIYQSGTDTRFAINDLGYRLQDCCCQLSRGQERIICENASNTANIIQANNANTQRILDYMCNEKISALQSENAVLKGQLSQNAQTTTIINALAPKVPNASYIVPNPFTGNCYNAGNCGCSSIQ